MKQLGVKENSGGNKKIIIIAAAAFVVVAIIIGVVVGGSSKKKKENENTPSEKTVVSGDTSIKWITDKKITGEFDVLSVDQAKLKDLIEKSLATNYVGKGESLKEHDFSSVAVTSNSVGYIDDNGVGIIFNLDPTGEYIDSISIVMDFSDNRSKDQTIISNYAACILNVLGEIGDLTKDNVNIYAGTIKVNNFNSVSKYSRYNDFLLRKIIHDDYTMLIIDHSNDTTITKLAKDEFYEITNCADSKYLTKEFAEKATEGDNAQ